MAKTRLQKIMMIKKPLLLGLTIAISTLNLSYVNASSHREAPLIAKQPKVDASDFYLFNSYESGREGYVTILANYIPLQDAFGGPNYYSMDEDALYEIHIDNNGDAKEDYTFQFDFNLQQKGISIDVGGVNVQIPLIQAGQVGPTAGDTGNLNDVETYRLNLITGDRRKGTSYPITKAGIANGLDFNKPVDNIGTKTIPDYADFSQQHITDIDIPNCGQGKVFVGQRKESFVASLGKIFDLVNLDPVGPVDAEQNFLQDKNVTTIALEVPSRCLTQGEETIIGGWTTASLPKRRNGRRFKQVSRLGSPLVNEVVIGLPQKDNFNGSEPKDDGQFAVFVTNPTLPELLEILFNVPAPNAFPRNDLIAAFLTGVEGLNQPAGVVASEMLRLNTAIAPVPAEEQSNLGVLGGDTSGFPNGRRPGDDVVDIALRVAMGVLLPEDVAPAGQLPFTDGAFIDASFFNNEFPYLLDPIAGNDDQQFTGINDGNRSTN